MQELKNWKPEPCPPGSSFGPNRWLACRPYAILSYLVFAYLILSYLSQVVPGFRGAPFDGLKDLGSDPRTCGSYLSQTPHLLADVGSGPPGCCSTGPRKVYTCIGPCIHVSGLLKAQANAALVIRSRQRCSFIPDLLLLCRVSECMLIETCENYA